MSQPKLTELSRTANQLDAKPEQIKTVTSPHPLRQEQALLRELISGDLPPMGELSFKISNSKVREREQMERIGQLERALEQSLGYLHDLRQQVRNQQMLETQLAAAEAFANVQQQAIAELKQQLARQQFSLAQLQHARWKLEKERDRFMQIEQQNLVLQAQILQQFQQAGEDAAAVQYWKEVALQLKEALEKLLIDRTPDRIVEVAKLLSAAQTLGEITATLPAAESMLAADWQQPLAVELPPFLTLGRTPNPE